MRGLVIGVCFAVLCLGEMACVSSKQVKKPISLNQKYLLDFARTRMARQKIKSLKGRADLAISARTLNPSSQVSFSIQRDKLLRIYINLSFMLYKTFAIVTSNGKRMGLYQKNNHRFTKGPSNRLIGYIRDLLHVPMAVEELIPILLADLPPFQDKLMQARAGKEKGIVVVLRKSDKGIQEVWLDVKNRRFVKVKIHRKGTPALWVTYKNYKGTPQMPQEILFSIPDKSVQVTWKFTGREINATIPTSAFTQAPPKGAYIHTLY